MQFVEHLPILDMLQKEIEREKALNAIPPKPAIPVLVPGLMRRLQKREEAMGGNLSTSKGFLPGAKEMKKDPLEYMDLCRQYLAKLDTMGWNRSYHQ